MVVVSVALVVVALVLLVVGLTGPLAAVYASIVVSALAGLVLLAALRRSGAARATAPATAPEAAPLSAPPAGVTDGDPADQRPPAPPAAPVAPVAPVDADAPVEDDDEVLDDDDEEHGGVVLVVRGPRAPQGGPSTPVASPGAATGRRYHVGGCRYLDGQEVEAVDVLDAREEGLLPCGECTPDLSLAAEIEAAERAEDRGPAAG